MFTKFNLFDDFEAISLDKLEQEILLYSTKGFKTSKVQKLNVIHENYDSRKGVDGILHESKEKYTY